MAPDDRAPSRSRTWRVFGAVLVGLGFAISYTQSPLYTGNQNTYLLYALASEGYGELAADWLAHTTDPTPSFTCLARLGYRILGPSAFVLSMLLLLGLYAVSLLAIVQDHAPTQAHGALVAALFVLHSKALDVASLRTAGVSLRSLLVNGVADQYLLGSTFQPAILGVFLMLSLWLFLRERPYLAVLSLLVAATFHPTYLMAAALMTLGYVAVQWRQGRARDALLTAGLALVGALPTVLYTLEVFRGTTPEVARRAAEIVVQQRIPHHALPQVWADWTVGVKLALVGCALWAVRRTRLFSPLAYLAAGGLVLTVVQLVTGSDRLALLFPWRVSVLLVPLSTMVVVSRGLTVASGCSPARLRSRAGWALTVAAIAASVVAGAVGQNMLHQRQVRALQAPLLAYVRENLAAGQAYLVPVEFETFRLDTGAPVYVDWKGRPFKDAEVLAWYDRVLSADDVYRSASTLKAIDWRSLKSDLRVTHIVLAAEQTLPSDSGLTLLHEDSAYRVYALP